MSNPAFVHKSDLTVYEFGESTEFIIGRSPSCNINIPETSISRTQCVVTKAPEDKWLILDKSSFKNTHLNGNPIPNNGVYLKEDDEISFANLKSYRFVFHENFEDLPRSSKRRKLDQGAVNVGSQEKWDRSSGIGSVNTESGDVPPAGLGMYQDKYVALLREKDTLSEKNATLSQTVVELEAQLKQLQEDKSTADSIITMSYSDHQRIQTDFEECISEVNSLAAERDSLVDELLEVNKTTQHCASGSTSFPSETENALILRSIEVEELLDELTETKLKLEKAEEVANNLETFKSQILNGAVTVIEQEFLCCVCSDILYEPVTLNCRHTMCRDCLKEWKKKKKECPSCRTKIKFETSPLMIDNFIERIAPFLGDEFIKRRKEAINERTAPQSPARTNAAPFSGGSSGRGRRGVRRAENRRTTRNFSTAIYEVIDLTARRFDNSGNGNPR